MFKKKATTNKSVNRVEPKIDSNKPNAQPEVKVSVRTIKKKKKKKSNWFNWFVPLLLISIGFGFLVLYPQPDAQPAPKPRVKQTATPVKTQFNAQLLSQELVTRYFNGTDENRKEQQNALENTLNILKESSQAQAKKALSELQGSNINAAKKSLITLAGAQSDLQQSSQTWINIGNIQNLSSSRQALQAFKKASELDSENINAYSRQAHVYRQLKQLNLAEKAFKRVQSFGNVSKGKLAEAEDAFNESLSIYKQIQDDDGIAEVSFNLANLYTGSERFIKAENYYNTALTTFTQKNEFKKMANTHAALIKPKLSLKRH